jgi:Zn-dependent protease/CBS domain-containing protein
MFGKRFNIMTVAGFKIGIDISWFFIAILLSWTLASGYFPFLYPHLSAGVYWTMGILGMLGLFVSVVLHELGHAVVARHFKLTVSQITLFIFGGVAELRNEPPSPKAEFWVAIAGPIVSVIIALCMFFLTKIGIHLKLPVSITAVTNYLALINIVIVIFNLIPAFPLDGGRVFRAILWGWKKNLGWATSITTHIGSAFGLILIFFGILSFVTGNFFVGLWWVIIGLFLQQAASTSRTQFYVRQELQGEKVLKFMTPTPISVGPTITIKDFINQYIYQSHHHLYPVTEEGNLLGYISLKEVKSLPHESWETTPVKKVMVPVSEFQTVSPNTNALEALNLIQQTDTSTLLVAEGNNLCGILTAQDLFKLISLKLELEE